MPGTALACAQWVRKKWVTSYRLNDWRTKLYGLTHARVRTQPTLVLGCQRSGTTMLANALSLSPLVKNYGEGHPRYFEWRGAPRLLALDAVAARLQEERHPFTLLKPLCESQRIAELCQRICSVRAVWIVRRYEPCVASHVAYYRQFHDGLAYVREMLQPGQRCWKNENLPADVWEKFQAVSGRQLNLPTAYALYWLARNSLYENLPRDLPVLLVHYEDVLESPGEALSVAFGSLGVPYHAKYAMAVHRPPPSARTDLANEIDEDVAQWCDALYRRLRATDRLTPPLEAGIASVY